MSVPSERALMGLSFGAIFIQTHLLFPFAQGGVSDGLLVPRNPRSESQRNDDERSDAQQ